ncbi:MAG: cytochrome ubiquinol oxidase subunit I [Planctomycetota bacterium]|nr:cytochrome ubiquinol oxidase subunit I [Planctomycetota bacterium]
MDLCMLSRIQFAVTVGFHFLFPPITIGLAWLLVIVEALAWRKKDPLWEEAGRFFARLLGLTFAVGVATGIVMEFQFGTNWARYSKFVGDIFGAPLAAEGVFAFFLESSFLGVYLFARKRLSKGWHWFSILMVAVGSTLSAFWIIVANSWMQTPAGHTYNAAAGRAELTDFWAAVFNPSTVIRYVHTVSAALVCGAFFMAGVASYILLKRGRQTTIPAADPAPMARRALKASLIFGLIAALLTAYPTGHHHAKQVAHTQPEKFAAIEGLYTSRTHAPLVMFALPFSAPPELKASIEVPGVLSWMAFGDVKAHVPGIDKFPQDEIPPLWMTFVSFHNMVLLGMLFIGSTALGLWRLRGGKLYTGRWFLWILLVISPLPLAACQFGWVTAEVGRQPWIVYRVMKTADAFSSNLTVAHVWFSLILFTAIYIVLLVLYLFLLHRQIHKSMNPQAQAA